MVETEDRIITRPKSALFIHMPRYIICSRRVETDTHEEEWKYISEPGGMDDDGTYKQRKPKNKREREKPK
jgi:hypothetical protein